MKWLGRESYFELERPSRLKNRDPGRPAVLAAILDAFSRRVIGWAGPDLQHPLLRSWQGRIG
jgi:hypothetical protein